MGLAIVVCTIGQRKLVVGSAPVDSSVDSGTVDLSGGLLAVDSPDDLVAVDVLLIWLFLCLPFSI